MIRDRKEKNLMLKTATKTNEQTEKKLTNLFSF